MGYGTESENSLPTTFFKIKGLKKGSEEIYFEGQRKEGSDYVLIDEKPSKLYGHLTGVSMGEFEWEGEKIRTVKFVIDDANERVILEGSFSNLIINLVNTIAGNKEKIDKIELGVYISSKGYASISIKFDDQDWSDNEWKFDYTKKLKPLIDETTDKKGKVVATDKTKLIEFLAKEIESKKFQDKIAGTPPAKSAPTEPSVNLDEPEPVADNIDEADDLPF
jgi:hypothetical protein